MRAPTWRSTASARLPSGKPPGSVSPGGAREPGPANGNELELIRSPGLAPARLFQAGKPTSATKALAGNHRMPHNLRVSPSLGHKFAVNGRFRVVSSLRRSDSIAQCVFSLEESFHGQQTIRGQPALFLPRQ